MGFDGEDQKKSDFSFLLKVNEQYLRLMPSAAHPLIACPFLTDELFILTADYTALETIRFVSVLFSILPCRSVVSESSRGAKNQDLTDN